MGEMMHTLLADSQRLEERRATSLLDKPASRADKIIAACDAARVRYRCENPNADSAMVYGRQIGLLNGEVRRLCNELENFAPIRDKHLMYCTVECDELGCDVLAGYTYSPGEDAQISGPPEHCYEGSPEELELCEVWVGGFDIAAVLLERVSEQISEAALNHHRDWLDGQRDEEAEARGMRWD